MVMFIFTLLCVGLSGSSFSVYVCWTVDGTARLASDMSIICDGEKDARYSVLLFASILGLVQAVGIPLLLILLLYHALFFRGGWSEKKRLYIAWLHTHLRVEAWWFEAFRILRKVTFVWVARNINSSSSVQLMMANLLLMLSIVVTAVYQPFRSTVANRIEITSQMLIAACLNMSFAFFGSGTDLQTTEEQRAAVGVGIVLTIVLIFLIYLFVLVRYEFITDKETGHQGYCAQVVKSARRISSRNNSTDIAGELIEMHSLRGSTSQVFNPEQVEGLGHDVAGGLRIRIPQIEEAIHCISLLCMSPQIEEALRCLEDQLHADRAMLDECELSSSDSDDSDDDVPDPLISMTDTAAAVDGNQLMDIFQRQITQMEGQDSDSARGSGRLADFEEGSGANDRLPLVPELAAATSTSRRQQSAASKVRSGTDGVLGGKLDHLSDEETLTSGADDELDLPVAKYSRSKCDC